MQQLDLTSAFKELATACEKNDYPRISAKIDQIPWHTLTSLDSGHGIDIGIELTHAIGSLIDAPDQQIANQGLARAKDLIFRDVVLPEPRPLGYHRVVLGEKALGYVERDWLLSSFARHWADKIPDVAERRQELEQIVAIFGDDPHYRGSMICAEEKLSALDKEDKQATQHAKNMATFAPTSQGTFPRKKKRPALCAGCPRKYIPA